ncbi:MULTISPECIES: ABC transporter ATP-binding protein [Enterococcus]|jgi:putative ABC transport system ATP-binding protein|uniref:ABC transporter ATP-binding protein n=1 Tax=Enterococcus dispar ATCC 51266 TaxID=1139219 RepID=S1NA49_9ENTE|nr:ABC transporter ATP-binding protein [Enterococcus dispar]EOT38393.1 ABC transporter ATP-binding protein [Enterococcus dispar ATCC 51266]EOW85920.1 ABC transporter ATP-binding protein [Enterococcus dispar ATCC 51266]MCU7356882.1 ABC transporter ATP-binding protein [Enterococcus dispar]MDT2704984.1 ABC transporter ATP-binding protein [Enterococcus dispar]OJG38522.1 ABC transporter ATP-binding protein [Enterococcus dispar]
MENIVEIKNVKKTYGSGNQKKTEALKGISFDVEKGEFVGIMGASGSGKSTLLNILSTLDKPTSGKVTINQKDVTKLKGNQLADFRSEEIGFIFQDFNLLENMTAAENIAVPLSLQGVKPKEIKQRVKKIAERLSITHILDSYPAAISGGQKQRVASARALVTQPTILLGDEPTGALDSKSARDLLDTMEELNEKDRVSILLVTHDPFSASYCQRILFIKDGVIHQELKRDEQTREEFYREILALLAEQ